MMLSATYQLADSKPIAGIKNPGLAMQFAQSEKDVKGLLGDPDPQAGHAQAARDNRQIMREQQYLDFVFMALYWMFFVLVVSVAMRASAKGRWLGWLVAAVISLTVVADVFENIGILSAVRVPSGSFWPFPFAVTKWLLFFATLGLS